MLAILLPAIVVFTFLFIRPVVLLVIVGLGQGVLVGVGLRLWWNWLGAKRGLATTSAVAGLASAAAVYLILYLREIVVVVRQSAHSTGELIRDMLGLGGLSPYRVLDQFMLVPATGHRGLVGYILYRMSETSQFSTMMMIHVGVCVLLSWRVGVYRGGQQRSALRPALEKRGEGLAG